MSIRITTSQLKRIIKEAILESSKLPAGSGDRPATEETVSEDLIKLKAKLKRVEHFADIKYLPKLNALVKRLEEYIEKRDIEGIANIASEFKEQGRDPKGEGGDYTNEDSDRAYNKFLAIELNQLSIGLDWFKMAPAPLPLPPRFNIPDKPRQPPPAKKANLFSRIFGKK